MFAENPSGIIAFLVEELGGKQDAVDYGPGRSVANIIQRDKVRVDAEAGFMTGGDGLGDGRIDPVGKDDVAVPIVRIVRVVDHAAAVEVDDLIANRGAQM